MLNTETKHVHGPIMVQRHEFLPERSMQQRGAKGGISGAQSHLVPRWDEIEQVFGLARDTRAELKREHGANFISTTHRAEQKY